MTLDFQIAGLLTLVLAAAGTAAAYAGWYLLRHSKASVGQKMRHYLLAHGALFFVTMLFGVAGFIHAPQWFWHTIYYARVVVLSMECFCLVTLIKEFYNIERKP